MTVKKKPGIIDKKVPVKVKKVVKKKSSGKTTGSLVAEMQKIIGDKLS